MTTVRMMVMRGAAPVFVGMLAVAALAGCSSGSPGKSIDQVWPSCCQSIPPYAQDYVNQGNALAKAAGGGSTKAGIADLKKAETEGRTVIQHIQSAIESLNTSDPGVGDMDTLEQQITTLQGDTASAITACATSFGTACVNAEKSLDTDLKNIDNTEKKLNSLVSNS